MYGYILFQQKCLQYWPEESNKEMVFGKLKVKLVGTQHSEDYCIRTLQVKKVDNLQTMYLRPHHFNISKCILFKLKISVICRISQSQQWLTLLPDDSAHSDQTFLYNKIFNL